MVPVIRYFLAIAVLLLPTLAKADIAQLFPPPFTASSQESVTPIASSGHLVLLSPAREVNDQIRSELMARLPVTGEGRLYQVFRDSSREQARDHYLKTLQGRGAQVLFDCRGVSCGRSVVWANAVFGQSVLYGRDNAQDYFVAATLDDDGSRWLTLVYTVTRGNLREYVWVEHLKVAAGASIPGFDGVKKRILGPVVVPWQGGVTYRFDLSAEERRRIRDWADQDGAVVVLVGYSALRDDESLTAALERARQASDSLAAVLARVGIPREQQQVLVVGPAVPMEDPDRQGDRVEIIVIAR